MKKSHIRLPRQWWSRIVGASAEKRGDGLGRPTYVKKRTGARLGRKASYYQDQGWISSASIGKRRLRFGRKCRRGGISRGWVPSSASVMCSQIGSLAGGRFGPLAALMRAPRGPFGTPYLLKRSQRVGLLGITPKSTRQKQNWALYASTTQQGRKHLYSACAVPLFPVQAALPFSCVLARHFQNLLPTWQSFGDFRIHLSRFFSENQSLLFEIWFSSVLESQITPRSYAAFLWPWNWLGRTGNGASLLNSRSTHSRVNTREKDAREIFSMLQPVADRWRGWGKLVSGSFLRARHYVCPSACPLMLEVVVDEMQPPPGCTNSFTFGALWV